MISIARFAAACVGRRDGDLAVVLDLDLGAGLLLDRADGLATWADDVADLVGRDLHGVEPRRVLRDVAARMIERGLHLAEDVEPARLGLLQRLSHDLARDALDLDVHLQRGDALRGAGDLEVHVAVVVFLAGDVGEDRELVVALDQAHRHAGDRRQQRHAGVEQREARRRRRWPSTTSRSTRGCRRPRGSCRETRPRPAARRAGRGAPGCRGRSRAGWGRAGT